MKYFLIFILLLVYITTYAKDSYILAFYNTENLFDTIPDKIHKDKDFTPKGKYKWDTEKYNTKITNICYVIDQIAADIIALSEVENENVIRDLVINLKTDYNYIVLENGDKRGINMALLYKGDKFIPTSHKKLASGTSRSFAKVSGKLSGIPINIIVCHMASNFNTTKYREAGFNTLREYANKYKSENTIIMGDFNASSTDKIFRNYMPEDYYNPFREFALIGRGSINYNNAWLMYDNMLLSEGFVGKSPLQYKSQGILIQPEILDPKTGYPLRSFSNGYYTKGFSDHLAIWCTIEKLH